MKNNIKSLEDSVLVLADELAADLHEQSESEIEDGQGSVDSSEPEEKQLPLSGFRPTANNTIQPNSLLRLAVFLPDSDVVSNSNDSMASVDVSAALTKLDIAKIEGYERVEIMGPNLNLFDFKVWCGVVFSYSQLGFESEKIVLPFKIYAKLCGFTSKRLDTPLRQAIHTSLIKLRSKSIAFSNSPKKNKGYITGLLKSAKYDEMSDTIVLEVDKEIWDLYAIDHTIILSLKAIHALPRNERAQALYIFIQSLPQNPVPITYRRFRNRLQLKGMSVKDQNRAIKRGLDALERIGYLRFEECDVDSYSGTERAVKILKRSTKLDLNSKENIDIN